MINKKKSYKVTIFGEMYTLISDEAEEQVVKSAALVDTLMKEIAGSSKISDAKKVAVLAAMRIASLLTQADGEKEADKVFKENLIKRIESALISS